MSNSRSQTSRTLAPRRLCAILETHLRPQESLPSPTPPRSSRSNHPHLCSWAIQSAINLALAASPRGTVTPTVLQDRKFLLSEMHSWASPTQFPFPLISVHSIILWLHFLELCGMTYTNLLSTMLSLPWIHTCASRWRSSYRTRHPNRSKVALLVFVQTAGGM